MRRLAVLLPALALSGCASWFRATIPAAQWRVEPSRREQVFASAVMVLKDRGFELAVTDPTSGVIQTEVANQPGRVPCGFVTCRYRDAWVITVDPDATVSVELKRELSSPVVWSTGSVLMLSEQWFAPAVTQGETVKGVETDQAALLREILR